MFSKNATKIDKIFTVDLTICSKYQIDGEDFVNFCGLLRKHKLYYLLVMLQADFFLGSHTVILLDWTLQKRALSSFAFQDC